MITIAVHEVLFFLLLSLLVLAWGGSYIWARGDRFDSRNTEYGGRYSDIFAASVTFVAALGVVVNLGLVLFEGVLALM